MLAKRAIKAESAAEESATEHEKPKSTKRSQPKNPLLETSAATKSIKIPARAKSPGPTRAEMSTNKGKGRIESTREESEEEVFVSNKIWIKFGGGARITGSSTNIFSVQRRERLAKLRGPPLEFSRITDRVRQGRNRDMRKLETTTAKDSEEYQQDEAKIYAKWHKANVKQRQKALAEWNELSDGAKRALLGLGVKEEIPGFDIRVDEDADPLEAAIKRRRPATGVCGM